MPDHGVYHAWSGYKDGKRKGRTPPCSASLYVPFAVHRHVDYTLRNASLPANRLRTPIGHNIRRSTPRDASMHVLLCLRCYCLLCASVIGRTCCEPELKTDALASLKWLQLMDCAMTNCGSVGNSYPLPLLHAFGADLRLVSLKASLV